MQGSIFWMAPEMLHNNKQGYNAKIDIWSLGCVVLEMWAGRRPWNQEDMFAVMFKVRARPTEASSTLAYLDNLSLVLRKRRRRCLRMWNWTLSKTTFGCSALLCMPFHAAIAVIHI
jgi:serine/threonine protein kinase